MEDLLEKIWLVYDIMHYTDQHRIQGLLMLIDFENAFDTSKFIYETPDFFKKFYLYQQ